MPQITHGEFTEGEGVAERVPAESEAKSFAYYGLAGEAANPQPKHQAEPVVALSDVPRITAAWPNASPACPLRFRLPVPLKPSQSRRPPS